MNGTECSYEPLPLKSLDKIITPLADDETYFCDTCKRLFIGKLQWNAHAKSNKHKKIVEKQKKLEAKKEDIVEASKIE